MATQRTTIVNLPPELLVLVVANLHTDRAFYDKQDLKATNLTCRPLHDAATAWIFRDMVFCLEIDAMVPERPGSYTWAESRMSLLLHTRPEYAQHVRSVQLRIEPFPVRNMWEEEAFGQLIRRMKLYERRTSPPGFSFWFGPLPKVVEERQAWIQELFGDLHDRDMVRVFQ